MANQRRERRLKEGEQNRLIEATAPCRNPYIGSIILIAIETGMRRGEILSMRWDHIDQIRKTLLIPNTKNGYPRTIPLTSKAIEVLNDVESVGMEVFPITANAFRLAWERVRTRAPGSEDLHFHDLRHEAISRFFEMGLSVPEVALISGHRDMKMLFRYAHAQIQSVHNKLKQHNMSKCYD
jgi:integrase